MARGIFWTPLALKDLVEIRDYIRRDNPSAARREADKIRASTERLSRFPLSGHPSRSVPTVRELITGNYRIFYRVRSSSVEILRVYHGRRKEIDM